MNQAAEFDPENDLADLKSAEDFLEFFGIAYDRAVLQVNRLHILQRFHNYLSASSARGAVSMPAYRALLEKAYLDFVQSDARTEKVFRVFQRQDGHVATIPLSAIGRAG